MELDKLYRDFGYWKVQEELVKQQLAITGKRIIDELSKQSKPEVKQGE